MFLNFIIKNNIKNKIKFIYLKKKELKRKLFIYFRKNNNIKNNKKIFSNINLEKFNFKTYISRQNNMCLISGRYKGIKKKFKISRHFLNKYAKLGIVNKLKSI